VWGKVGLLAARSDAHQKDMGPLDLREFSVQEQGKGIGTRE
jgi:hypothetical protein